MSRPARRTIGWHRIIFFHLPSHLEATSTRPSSSSSSLSSSLAARVGSLSSRNQKKAHYYALSSFLSFSLAIPGSDVRSSSRADHSMLFPPNRLPLDRRLTSRKILPSALISLFPRPSRSAREILSVRSLTTDLPFCDKSVSYESRHLFTDDPFADPYGRRSLVLKIKTRTVRVCEN